MIDIEMLEFKQVLIGLLKVIGIQKGNFVPVWFCKTQPFIESMF